MKKASEYRAHAEECRQLATKAVTAAEREHLLKMAATWDALAADREAIAARRPADNKAEN